MDLSWIFILSIVLTNCVIPSSAKNSVCNGTKNFISTETKAIIVSKLNEGGQSIKILSYFFIISEFLFKISFKINALFSSLAVSTSKPDRFTLEPNISNFLYLFFAIHLLNQFF